MVTAASTQERRALIWSHWDRDGGLRLRHDEVVVALGITVRLGDPPTSQDGRLRTVHAQGAGPIHQDHSGLRQLPEVSRRNSRSNHSSVLIIAAPIECFVKFTCARAEQLKHTRELPRITPGSRDIGIPLLE